MSGVKGGRLVPACYEPCSVQVSQRRSVRTVDWRSMCSVLYVGNITGTKLLVFLLLCHCWFHVMSVIVIALFWCSMKLIVYVCIQSRIWRLVSVLGVTDSIYTANTMLSPGATLSVVTHHCAMCKLVVVMATASTWLNLFTFTSDSLLLHLLVQLDSCCEGDALCAPLCAVDRAAAVHCARKTARAAIFVTSP